MKDGVECTLDLFIFKDLMVNCAEQFMDFFQYTRDSAVPPFQFDKNA